MIRYLLAGLLICMPASAHIDPENAAEHHANNAWLNRQRALDNTKCCDEHDVEVLVDPRWRITAAGYEVFFSERWHPVPAGRLMQPNPQDPTPYPGQALLFRTGATIWCFTPAPLY
jgi:hypothetical protein